MTEWSASEGTDGASWGDEPASLVESTALFCDRAPAWTGADGVSLALLTASPNTRELLYASDAIAQHIDELQFAIGEGPCLASYAARRPKCIIELAHETRWPQFCREVAQLGVKAVFSFPVSVNSHPVGVLELYRHDSGGMTIDEYTAALGCAAAVGAVIGATYELQVHRLTDGEEIDGPTLFALTASDPWAGSPVHPAADIIAGHFAVSVTEALLRMRAYAFARDVLITEVAENIVEQRLPPDDWNDDTSDEGHTSRSA
jgi:hypothetical protein